MVEDLAFEQGQPDMSDKISWFTWESDTNVEEPFGDAEDDGEDDSINDEPIDLGFIDPRAENIVSDEIDSDGGDEHSILEANIAENQAEDETNGALAAVLIVDKDVVTEDDDDLSLTEDISDIQEDIIRDDNSAHSSEWSFNLDNILHESHNDTAILKTVDDTEEYINGTLLTETVAYRCRPTNASRSTKNDHWPLCSKNLSSSMTDWWKESE